MIRTEGMEYGVGEFRLSAATLEIPGALGVLPDVGRAQRTVEFGQFAFLDGDIKPVSNPLVVERGPLLELLMP